MALQFNGDSVADNQLLTVRQAGDLNPLHSSYTRIDS